MKTAWFSILILLLFAGSGCDSAGRVVAPDPADEQVRMSIGPVQCGSNPWEQAGAPIEEYYEGLGVTVHEIETSVYTRFVCLSCSCPTGERIDMLVDERSVPFLLSEGFVRFEEWPFG